MHPLLARQIRKHWGDRPLPDEVQPLLDAVSEAYQAADDDRAMLERAMDLTSQEMAQQNRDLTAANDRLRRADEARRDFINTAAHELSTPLTPMKLQIHNLKARAPEKDLAGLRLLERNLDRVLALSADLLDSARIQTGALPMGTALVDVAQVAESSGQAHRPMADERRVTLTMDLGGPAPVMIEEARLRQVLDNLVTNALRHADAGGHITLRVESGEKVTVQVQDDGAGIAAERLQDVFQPFSHTVSRTDGAPDGTGLGLYICKGIVEAVGGRITVSSPGPGQGATFTVRLPKAD